MDFHTGLRELALLSEQAEREFGSRPEIDASESDDNFCSQLFSTCHIVGEAVG